MNVYYLLSIKTYYHKLFELLFSAVFTNIHNLVFTDLYYFYADII